LRSLLALALVSCAPRPAAPPGLPAASDDDAAAPAPGVEADAVSLEEYARRLAP